MKKSQLFRILLLSGLLLIPIYVHRYVLIVRTISCHISNQNIECPIPAYSKLQKLLGTPLLFTKIPTQAAELLSDEPYSITSIRRDLPSTVVVKLAATTYSFGIRSESKNYVITTTGDVLEREIPSELPVLLLPDSLLSDQTMPDTKLLTMGASIFEALESRRIQYKSVSLRSAQELQIDLQNHEITAIVNPSKASEQLANLNLILESKEVREIPEQIKEIDLRFDFPVVRTNVLDTKPESNTSL